MKFPDIPNNPEAKANRACFTLDLVRHGVRCGRMERETERDAFRQLLRDAYAAKVKFTLRRNGDIVALTPKGYKNDALTKRVPNHDGPLRALVTGQWEREIEALSPSRRLQLDSEAAQLVITDSLPPRLARALAWGTWREEVVMEGPEVLKYAISLFGATVTAVHQTADLTPSKISDQMWAPTEAHLFSDGNDASSQFVDSLENSRHSDMSHYEFDTGDDVGSHYERMPGLCPHCGNRTNQTVETAGSCHRNVTIEP